MDYAEFKGSPRERGEQHGERFRDQIADLIEMWSVLDLPDEPLATIERYLAETFPALHDEICGIAAASGQSLRDVVGLNCFNALQWWGQAGCTSVGVRAGDDWLLGKTTDVDEKQAKCSFVRKVVPESGAPFLLVGWYGTVWCEAALTANGVAIGVNSAPAFPDGQDGRGLPQHIGPYPHLSFAADAEDMVTMLRGDVLAGKGINMMIGNSKGGLVAVEKSFNRQGERRPTPNQLVFGTTNHFLTPETEFRQHAKQANSEGRMRTIESRAANWDGSDPEDFLKDLLASHDETGPICQHDQDGLTTFFSFVIDPSAGIIQANAGFACDRNYVTYSL